MSQMEKDKLKELLKKKQEMSVSKTLKVKEVVINKPSYKEKDLKLFDFFIKFLF